MRSIKPGKPKLSQSAWQLILDMHSGPLYRDQRIPPTVRNELIGLDMLCYSDGWKLTKRGKDLARYLTGRK